MIAKIQSIQNSSTHQKKIQGEVPRENINENIFFVHILDGAT